MSKTEIMAELAHLSPDDLAEVRAWLERQALDKTSASARPSPRVRSPRLANPAQRRDFIKQVMELRSHAKL